MNDDTFRLAVLRWSRNNSFKCVFLCTLFFWSLVFVVFNSLAQDDRYLDINAETETLSFRVMRPEYATIPLVGATISNQSHCENVLTGYDDKDFIGLVRPNEGTTVTYRFSEERISIRLESKNVTDVRSNKETFSSGELIISGKACSLTHTTVFVYPVSTENARPLPIAGPVEIGVPFGPPLEPERGRLAHEGLMYSAEVSVFGRSLLTNKLFPLYDSPISIPAGGTLTSVDFDSSQHTSGRKVGYSAAWFGIAELGKRAFLVSATVQTTDLVFTGAGSSGEKETIAVSFFTEVVRDPDLSAIILWSGLLLFMFQLVATMFSMVSYRDINE